MVGRCVSGAVLLFALAAPAAAQARRGPVPARGMNAVGLSAGLAVPGDDTLSSGPVLALSVEHYFRRRLSIRGQLSGAWFDIADTGDDNGVSPAAFDANVVYNWEGGAVHPYVTAGLGLYTYRFTENDVDSHDATAGVNLGGGVEYFFTRRDTLTIELLFRPIVGEVDSVSRSYTPWYWSASGGYKKYF
jgi:hypothetical protein